MRQTTIESNDRKLNADEIDVGELLKAIFQYKWSILFIAVIALLVAAFYLYFKTPVYSAQALIEVKSETKQGMPSGDLIGSAFSSFGDEKVGKG